VRLPGLCRLVIMGELLGALGLAWPRLLLYPGGLFALGASWLLARWLRRCAGGPAVATPAPASAADLVAILPPLVVLSLLPLAPARGFPYGLDLVVAVGLLEWPYLRGVAGRALSRAEIVRRYGPLIVGALLMAEAAGGLGLSRLLTWPEAWLDQALLLSGAGVWLLALPALLAEGPWSLAGRLRALGLLLVGTLPVLGALAALMAGVVPGWLAGWLLPPIAMALAAGMLGGAVRVRSVVRALVPLPPR
jgi:hypothetical protein